MTDLTRYLILADRLEDDVDLCACVWTGSLEDAFLEQKCAACESASAMRSLVERVRELENVAKPFDFAHAGFAEVLWGHLPDDTPGTITVPLGAQRRLHNALAQGKPGEADEFSTPTSGAGKGLGGKLSHLWRFGDRF